MFHGECVVIERLEMTLGGMLFDAACQGLTAGPLTGGKGGGEVGVKGQ